MDKNKTRILIVGGGFAGVKTALCLAHSDKGEHADITLLSDHKHFRYYPALYHTAVGGKREGARIRLENMFANLPVTVVRGTAKKLDRETKLVTTDNDLELPYDKVIFALGNITNYFGIEGMEQNSFGIKSTELAEEFRDHLHRQFVENGKPDDNYVIVGAGPTGIELAGVLGNYLHATAKKHKVKGAKFNILLVEAMPKLLPRSPEDISNKVAKRLEKLGVTLKVNSAVKKLTDSEITIGEEVLPTRTVVWTAGVTTSPFFKENNFKMTDKGKVEVNEFLESEPDIYVLGDNANTQFSGTAQTALHNGHYMAENLARELLGKQREAYVPKKPISVIPVGSMWATVEWGNYKTAGLIGWALRHGAEFLGFHDLLPLTKSIPQWFRNLHEEELNCPNCIQKSNKTAEPAPANN